MYLFFLLLISLLIKSNSFDELDCYFIITYSNGSRTLCLDEYCSDHLDIISIEDYQCQTNSLSLKFSSYEKYRQFLNQTSSRIPLSSFFTNDRPQYERLLQIHFLSPLDNSQAFQYEQLHLLSGPNSNIDTYELIFNGTISKINSILYIDKDFFLSNQQTFVDTLRLRFNCTSNETIEWELTKSSQYLPESPCQQQIQFLPKQQIHQQSKCFHWNFLISTIAIFCILILIIIGLLLWIYHFKSCRKILFQSNSQIELIEKF